MFLLIKMLGSYLRQLPIVLPQQTKEPLWTVSIVPCLADKSFGAARAQQLYEMFCNSNWTFWFKFVAPKGTANVSCHASFEGMLLHCFSVLC